MGQARLLRDVGERAVAIVVEQVAGRLAIADLGIEAAAVDQEDVEPAVVVVVEERDAAAHLLEQELLVGRASRDVEGRARPAASVTSVKTTGRGRRVGGPPPGHGEAAIGRGDERAADELQEPAARSGAAGTATHAPAPAAWRVLRCARARFFSSSADS